MSPIMQQRLVGSILLLCALLAVAFWLMSSARNDIEIVADVEPDIPFVSSIDVESEETNEFIDTEQAVLVDTQIPESNITVEETQQQQADISAEIDLSARTEVNKRDSDATMWSLQIASLADHSAAITLRNKVNKLGYNALVEKAETTKGIRYRVRIGPEQDKVMLETISKRLENELKLKPLLLKQSS